MWLEFELDFKRKLWPSQEESGDRPFQAESRVWKTDMRQGVFEKCVKRSCVQYELNAKNIG